MPDPLAAYTGELLARLRAGLGDEIVGVWLMGSLALGGYDPERSDVDVLMITRGRLPRAARRAVAAGIDPRLRPSPGSGLEFVWYAQEDVRPLGDPPAFQLNLNGGRAREHKVQFGPGAEAAHWFVIDLAIGRDAARAVTGPPLRDVTDPVDPQRLRAALRESLEWHDGHDPTSPNRVLNAARAAVFAETGRWLDKVSAAAELGAFAPGLASALSAALQARRTATPMASEQATPVIDLARRLLSRETD